MSIEGISHLTLVVEDLQRTGDLFSTVLGAKEVYDSGDRCFSLSRERFYILGGTWIALMEGEARPQRSYDHIAFRVSESKLEEYRVRLQNVGVEFREERPRIEGEGRSLYFYDYDDHLFELHTGNLEERLAAYDRSR